MKKWMAVAIVLMVLAPIFFQIALRHFRADEDVTGTFLVIGSICLVVHALLAASTSGEQKVNPPLRPNDVAIIVTVWDPGPNTQKAVVRFPDKRLKIVDCCVEYKVGDHISWDVAAGKFVRFA